MSKRDVKLYVRDILEAIKAIEKFVERISAYPVERDGRFPRQTYTFLLWYKIRYCMGHHKIEAS